MIKRDVARWAAALERPGIDPRTWTTLAVVTAVKVTEHGVMVDIQTIAGIDETASVATEYAGPGFGLYAPIAVDDFVVVEFPEGVPNTGGRVLGRVVDEGSPPPGDVMDHPEDFILVVKPDSNLRMIVSGSGDAMIAARGAGKVRLGDETADDPVALKSDLDAFKSGMSAQIVIWQAAIAALVSGLPATQPAIDALQAKIDAVQAVLDALPSGWPFCATKVTAI